MMKTVVETKRFLTTALRMPGALELSVDVREADSVTEAAAKAQIAYTLQFPDLNRLDIAVVVRQIPDNESDDEALAGTLTRSPYSIQSL